MGFRFKWKPIPNPPRFHALYQREEMQVIKVGLINYFMDDYHCNHFHQWIKEISGGEVLAKYSWAMLDKPPADYLFKQQNRTTEQWCRDYGIEQCASPEEVVAKSDVLLINTPDYFCTHEALCQAPFRSGKPTFVDKNFAMNYMTAKRMADLAAACDTPWFSASALRFLPEYQKVKTDDIIDITLWWDSDDVHIIHMVEPVIMLMKAAPVRVMRVAGKGFSHSMLGFDDGRYATLSGYDPYRSGLPMRMSVCHSAATLSSHENIDLISDVYHGLMVEIVNFFRTGKAPVQPQETLNIMAIIDALALAKKRPGEWVEISEIRGE